jgi:hypothetical protein
MSKWQQSMTPLIFAGIPNFPVDVLTDIVIRLAKEKCINTFPCRLPSLLSNIALLVKIHIGELSCQQQKY